MGDFETPLGELFQSTVGDILWVLAQSRGSDELVLQQEIADEIGVTQPMVSRRLKPLRKRGMVIQHARTGGGGGGVELNDAHRISNQVIFLVRELAVGWDELEADD